MTAADVHNGYHCPNQAEKLAYWKYWHCRHYKLYTVAKIRASSFLLLLHGKDGPCQTKKVSPLTVAPECKLSMVASASNRKTSQMLGLTFPKTIFP
jgi:hypothetical protein